RNVKYIVSCVYRILVAFSSRRQTLKFSEGVIGREKPRFVRDFSSRFDKNPLVICRFVNSDKKLIIFFFKYELGFFLSANYVFIHTIRSMVFIEFSVENRFIVVTPLKTSGGVS